MRIPQLPEPTFRLGYRPWLDGLRGVAILLVMANHLGLIVGGVIGVDLFFVLSGFLITCLLVEEHRRSGTIHLGRFYLRRALRLLPALAITLAALAVWVALTQPERLKDLHREVVVVVCCGANWGTIHHVPMARLSHAWSLAVEEQFYFLWPAVLFVLLRWRAPRWAVLSVVAAGIAGSALARGWHLGGFSHPADGVPGATLVRVYTGLDTRAEGLLWGCLTGLLASWGMLPRTAAFRRGVRTASVCAVCLLAAYAAGFGWAWLSSSFYPLTLISLAAATVLARPLLGGPADLRGLLEMPWLVGTGRISYGLYLFHYPIIHELDRLGLRDRGWAAPGNTLLLLAVSFAAALASYHGVERPLLRLKDRLAPAAPPVAAPAGRQAA